MRWEDHITFTAGVRSGKPCIKGTRITPVDVLQYLASGMSEAEVLADFPQLRPEHIWGRSCICSGEGAAPR
ncbi:MAG: DUF433 domain-containing protein [Phycisphaerae bacterium]|nr:DUF433 domain-containing protein [Phycisphaerae bacterium]